MIRILAVLFALFASDTLAHAQILSYPNPYLDYVYPAGGKQGQTVEVEFGAVGGLDGAKDILIDGPPGITVRDVKAVSGSLVKATFAIAADAVPGRRYVRVLGGANGLTNFRYFLVGNMNEVLEKEPNNTTSTAQEISVPAVVNGRIEKDLDVDCYRFQAKAGQRFVIAILAHGMDSVYRASFIQGFVDTSLELLDDQGKVLAAADDTLGLDPAIQHTFKSDGKYVVRVQSLSYKGSLSSVYRLTIGDVPYPTSAFPAGAERGKSFVASVIGMNLDKPIEHKLTMPRDGAFPLHFLPHQSGPTSGFDLPTVRGELPEIIETEPNNDAKSAMRVSLPVVINGRIDAKGDEDWYRMTLKKGQPVTFEVTAQRHLRSPIDSMLEIYDAGGKKLAENDDGLQFAHQCAGDFASADSWLPFTAPADGEYLVRLRDQSGVFGPHAVYRLAIQDSAPPFVLYQWPDAVPIWGPGTTATFVVELCHWGLQSDVELRVEGLPKEWTGSSVTISRSTFGIYVVPNANRQLLTITAPADAVPGTHVPFRVVGKVQHEGKVIEREALYLTLYGNAHNDRMFLRASHGARAVVAGHMDAWPIVDVKELTVTHGETVQIPVRFVRKPDAKRANIGVVINGPTVAAGCGLGPPVTLPADQDSLMMPLTISPEMPIGTRGIVIARSWSSDIRGGRPGPCTPIITLHVKAKEKK
jgi:hypothetical protein